MAVPKSKASKARTRRRLAVNSRLSAVNLSECGNCGAKKLPHRVCPKCGYYRGRQVLSTEELS